MDLAVALPAGAAARPVPSSRSRDAPALAADVLPLCDFGCVAMAGWTSTTLCAHWAAALMQPAITDAHEAVLMAAVLAAFILYSKRFGSIAASGATRTLLRAHAVRFASFAVIVGMLNFNSLSGHSAAPYWLALWFALGVVSTLLVRTLLARYVQQLQRQGALTQAVAVVGAGAVADRLVQRLLARSARIELIGVFDDDPPGAAPGVLKPIGTVAQLIELGKTRSIDWIVLALPQATEHTLHALEQRLRVLRVPIGLCSQHIGQTALDHRVDHLCGFLPIAVLADRPIKHWDAVTKSIEDLLLGVLAILFLLPVFALVALAIKLDSPGPVIFRQRRHALNNGTFEIYKFRTMRWDPSADSVELRQTTHDDERVTPLGRFLRVSSLDELPQLLNVLKGEMSIVGPRPLAVNMRTEGLLCAEITDLYAHRHRVKPGITGWSQVMGSRGATRTTAELRRRVDLDLHYIEHWSLFFDLKILALTSLEVVRATNAY